jgi:exodeoxyribonuclease VII large subunit
VHPQQDRLQNSPDIPIWSVKEISFALKRTVESTYGYVRVRGEISGLKRHSSGHLYYALKDEDAVLDAVSWRGSYSQAPIALEEGLEIIATGRLTTYPGRSKYQMVVERFEASGRGALLKLLEERKQKLASEGLFDSARKKLLPSLPTTVGVITSPTGAVIRDILHRIQDRFPCHVIVWPVAVQGVGAAEQIAAAIKGFNCLATKPDVLIVARGGGSIEDLWAFNEEIVVRAAAASSIPLISAVGHETDTTLIDFAADRRAPTPTAAAEIVVPVLSNLWNFIQERHQRLNIAMSKQLQHDVLRLSLAAKGLIHPRSYLEERLLKLDDLSDRLNRGIASFFLFTHQRWLTFDSRLRAPADLLQQMTLQMQHLQQRLDRAFQVYFTKTNQHFDQLQNRLMQGSVQKVLERGFCLATDQKGHLIASHQDVPDSPFQIQFHDGKVDVTCYHQPHQPRLF